MAVPVGLAHHLVDAVALDAGAAAVGEHHVGVLRPGLVEAGEDGAGIADVLPARDGDQGSLGQVRAGFAVLPLPHEVAGVDGGGGEVPGLAGVAAAARGQTSPVSVR